METNKREIWLNLQRDGLNEFNVLWIQSNGVHFLSDQKIWNCNFSLTCFRCPQETLGRDAAVVREQRRRTLYLSPSPHCNIGVDLPSETPTGSYQLCQASTPTAISKTGGRTTESQLPASQTDLQGVVSWGKWGDISSQEKLLLWWMRLGPSAGPSSLTQLGQPDQTNSPVSVC